MQCMLPRGPGPPGRRRGSEDRTGGGGVLPTGEGKGPSPSSPAVSLDRTHIPPWAFGPPPGPLPPPPPPPRISCVSLHYIHTIVQLYIYIPRPTPRPRRGHACPRHCPGPTLPPICLPAPASTPPGCPRLCPILEDKFLAVLKANVSNRCAKKQDSREKSTEDRKYNCNLNESVYLAAWWFFLRHCPLSEVALTWGRAPPPTPRHTIRETCPWVRRPLGPPTRDSPVRPTDPSTPLSSRPRRPLQSRQWCFPPPHRWN